MLSTSYIGTVRFKKNKTSRQSQSHEGKPSSESDVDSCTTRAAVVVERLVSNHAVVK